MSYDSYESSVEEGRPYELYRFVMGTQEFYFTSAEDEITYNGDDYQPVEISRGPVVLGKQERAKVMSIKIAATSSLAQRYVGPPPGERATVSIFRFQREDGTGTAALIYSGTVKSATFPANGQFTELNCQSLEASSNRAIPRRTYMGMCNHLLYSTACGVNQASHKHLGAVTAVVDNVMTISGLSASGLDAVGGYMENSTGIEKRQILAQSGDDVTVLLPFENDPTSTTVTVYAGCNRVLTSDCAVTFSNEARFGGFAFVPNRNPFTAGI